MRTSTAAKTPSISLPCKNYSNLHPNFNHSPFLLWAFFKAKGPRGGEEVVSNNLSWDAAQAVQFKAIGFDQMSSISALEQKTHKDLRWVGMGHMSRRSWKLNETLHKCHFIACRLGDGNAANTVGQRKQRKQQRSVGCRTSFIYTHTHTRTVQ